MDGYFPRPREDPDDDRSGDGVGHHGSQNRYGHRPAHLQGMGYHRYSQNGQGRDEHSGGGHRGHGRTAYSPVTHYLTMDGRNITIEPLWWYRGSLWHSRRQITPTSYASDYFTQTLMDLSAYSISRWFDIVSNPLLLATVLTTMTALHAAADILAVVLRYRNLVLHVRNRNLKPLRYRNGVHTPFGALAATLMLPVASCNALFSVDGSKMIQTATYTSDTSPSSNLAHQLTADETTSPDASREEARGIGGKVLSTSEATNELDKHIQFSFSKGGKCDMKIDNHVIATVDGAKGNVEFMTLPNKFLPESAENRKKIKQQTFASMQKLLQSDEQSIKSGGRGKFSDEAIKHLANQVKAEKTVTPDTHKPGLVPNKVFALLLMAAKTTFITTYAGKVRSVSCLSDRKPRHDGRRSPKRFIPSIMDTGTNVTLFDIDFVRQQGIEVDPVKCLKVESAEGESFSTSGETKSPVELNFKGVNGRMGHLKTIGQAAPTGGKNLVNAVTLMCRQIGFSMVIKFGPKGENLCQMIDSDGHQYGLPLNEQQLPCLDEPGHKFDVPSNPETLDALSKYFAGLAKKQARRASNSADANTSDVQTVLNSSLHSTYSSGDNTSDSDSENSSVLETALMAHKRQKRNRLHKAVHSLKSQHEVLHRSAKQTRKTLGDAFIQDPSINDGKVTEIKDVREELLAYPNCDVCKQVRASAPVARQANSASDETGFVCVHCKGGHK